MGFWRWKQPWNDFAYSSRALPRAFSGSNARTKNMSVEAYERASSGSYAHIVKNMSVKSYERTYALLKSVLPGASTRFLRLQRTHYRQPYERTFSSSKARTKNNMSVKSYKRTLSGSNARNKNNMVKSYERAYTLQGFIIYIRYSETSQWRWCITFILQKLVNDCRASFAIHKLINDVCDWLSPFRDKLKCWEKKTR